MSLASIVRRNAVVYRHTWRGSLMLSFLQPTLFLLSMGLGVGAMVDRGGAALPGGVAFLSFLAPGLLAASCMQTAAFELSWPVLSRINWQRNYEAITATPVRISDIVFGELTWLAMRLTMAASVFFVVMSAFGVARSPWAALAVPAAVLTGLAIGAPVIALAATLKNGNGFNVMFRFVIAPLFLFSGVFFPIERLPRVLQVVAAFTPLYHGVALTRALTLGISEPTSLLTHIAYLTLLFAAGSITAVWTFTRRLHV